MNILILSPYPPYPPHGGGTMRIYQIIRGLAARHQVTCLTFVPDVEAERALAPLRSTCQVLTVPGPPFRSTLRRAWTTLTSALPDMALRNAARAYSQALRELTASVPFDIVQAESIEMAGYLQVVGQRSRGGELPSAAHPRPCATILDQFNAEYLIQRRAFFTDVQQPRRLHAAAYSLVQWFKLARYERRVMRSCDAVVAVSEEDRRMLHRLDPSLRVAVVANGVDTTFFSREALAQASSEAVVPAIGSCALVFSGTLDYRPNVDAAIWFAREVLPRVRARRPDVRLFLVGKRPAPALRDLTADGATVVVGEVPDARPYIAGAAVYVVPMRIGGGVRLKLLEALALEAPVVSTTMGAEGLAGLRSGEHCLLADDPADFADAVVRLLADQALGKRIAAQGRALVRANYDWSVIVPKLELLYQQIVTNTASQ